MFKTISFMDIGVSIVRDKFATGRKFLIAINKSPTTKNEKDISQNIEG